MDYTDSRTCYAKSVGTLCTIHNEHYTVRLVEKMREAIADGTFDEYEEETLGRFYGSGPAGQRG